MKTICDWNNCNNIGEYKAPVEKDNSKKYRLLCLEHIKEFNKNWNYFENMNDTEIMEFIKADMTWHKPTQNFSAQDNFFKILWNNALKEELNKNGYDKNKAKLANSPKYTSKIYNNAISSVKFLKSLILIDPCLFDNFFPSFP